MAQFEPPVFHMEREYYIFRSILSFLINKFLLDIFQLNRRILLFHEELWATLIASSFLYFLRLVWSHLRSFPFFFHVIDKNIVSI